MKNFFKSTKFKVIICVLTALLCGMLIAAFTSTSESPVTSIAGVIYKPFQKAAAYIVEKTQDWQGSFVSSSEYKEQVKELESDILEYNEKLVDYERTKQKLESYEAMLGVKNENPDYELVSASVISKNTADAYDSVTLDKGSTSGIEVNDPVVYGENVIGIVKEVGLATCVVKTVLDPSVNISVYEIKSRESGYSNTTASLSYEGLCRMSGLSKETSVAAGGIVCTSGLGGNFPRDLVVGTVTVLKSEETDMSVYAVIEPAVDVRAVNDVFVITDFISDVES
ncbi:MAG: rod shape-determining protein MreC [Clostridia bacterium]|nr:rod shape-determining protein MreC [Clostridia bacterium]